MNAVGIAAATESTVWSFLIAPPLVEELLEVLRLHGEDDEARAGDGLRVRERRVDAVRSLSSAARSARRAVGDQVGRHRS